MRTFCKAAENIRVKYSPINSKNRKDMAEKYKTAGLNEETYLSIWHLVVFCLFLTGSIAAVLPGQNVPFVLLLGSLPHPR